MPPPSSTVPAAAAERAGRLATAVGEHEPAGVRDDAGRRCRRDPQVGVVQPRPRCGGSCRCCGRSRLSGAAAGRRSGCRSQVERALRPRARGPRRAPSSRRCRPARRALDRRRAGARSSCRPTQVRCRSRRQRARPASVPAAEGVRARGGGGARGDGEGARRSASTPPSQLRAAGQPCASRREARRCRRRPPKRARGRRAAAAREHEPPASEVDRCRRCRAGRRSAPCSPRCAGSCRVLWISGRGAAAVDVAVGRGQLEQAALASVRPSIAVRPALVSVPRAGRCVVTRERRRDAHRPASERAGDRHRPGRTVPVLSVAVEPAGMQTSSPSAGRRSEVPVGRHAPVAGRRRLEGDVAAGAPVACAAVARPASTSEAASAIRSLITTRSPASGAARRR